MATVQELIGKAIDTQDAKLAGRLTSWLRQRGLTYSDIFARVQVARPAVTAAEWDGLLYEADEQEAEEV